MECLHVLKRVEIALQEVGNAYKSKQKKTLKETDINVIADGKIQHVKYTQAVLRYPNKT